MLVKKIILNIILVLATIFFIDFLVGYTLRYCYFKEASGSHYRTTYLMEKTNADVLVFGSSEALHHYVPEVFEKGLNMTFYNGGSDGSSILNHTAVLKSVLKRYTPKLIILDYSGSMGFDQTDYDRMATTLIPYYKTHPEIRSCVELKGPYEKIKLLSEIYPFNSQLLTIAMGNLEQNKQRKADHKGYVALYNQWHSEIVTEKTITPYLPDSNKIKAFTDFISLAQHSGSKVIVLFSPIYMKFANRQELALCNDICKMEKVDCWDFSTDTTFLNNRTLFQDVEHLNNSGANLFSKIIVDKIVNSYQ